MRICYFADGRYIHARRWMKYFADKGHEMHLISFAPISAEDIAMIEAIGARYLGSIGNFHLKKFWLTLRDLQKLKSTLRNARIEILHSHFLGQNAWFAALSRFHPHVLTVMGGDVMGANWAPNKNAQERIFSPIALRNADAITAWSASLADRIRPFCKTDATIDILHGGIELANFTPGPKPAQLLEKLEIPSSGYVVFSPRLVRRLYNIDKIVDAAAAVRAIRSDVYFLIALPSVILDEDYFAVIRESVARNGLETLIRFVDSIEYHEIADYIRLADVTVSIPDTDGTPMSVLESMACGTSTVIGNLPDYDRDYFEHEKTTLMVDVKDPQSIATAIMRYLSDSEFTRRITQEARRRVEATGAYEHQMSKMEEIYHRVLKK